MQNLIINESVEARISQGFPLVGPGVVSPIVAIVNLVKTIAGGIFALVGTLSSNPSLKNRGISLAKEGGINIAYSLLNMVTLGVTGFIGGLIGITMKANFNGCAR